jgi:Fe2+ transport system protein B
MTRKPFNLATKTVDEKLSDLNQSPAVSDSTESAVEAIKGELMDKMRLLRELNAVEDTRIIKSSLTVPQFEKLQENVRDHNKMIDRRKEKRVTQESLIAKYVIEGIERDKKKFDKNLK